MSNNAKANNTVVRLEHAMTRGEASGPSRTTIRPYTVNRLGRAVTAARRVMYELEEMISKIETCKRHLGMWKSEKVHESMTVETHRELLQEVANIRTDIRELFRQLAIKETRKK